MRLHCANPLQLIRVEGSDQTLDGCCIIRVEKVVKDRNYVIREVLVGIVTPKCKSRIRVVVLPVVIPCNDVGGFQPSERKFCSCLHV